MTIKPYLQLIKKAFLSKQKSGTAYGKINMG